MTALYNSVLGEWDSLAKLIWEVVRLFPGCEDAWLKNFRRPENTLEKAMANYQRHMCIGDRLDYMYLPSEPLRSVCLDISLHALASPRASDALSVTADMRKLCTAVRKGRVAVLRNCFPDQESRADGLPMFVLSVREGGQLCFLRWDGQWEALWEVSLDDRIFQCGNTVQDIEGVLRGDGVRRKK